MSICQKIIAKRKSGASSIVVIELNDDGRFKVLLKDGFTFHPEVVFSSVKDAVIKFITALNEFYPDDLVSELESPLVEEFISNDDMNSIVGEIYLT